ncbi:MAG TPA: ferritin-like domain-containing protein [Thermomicrobiales bacterium]|jgi:plastocyanin|nr:ferritin-like domain-containing protein [Thermomicrobiales bacterium]
MTQDDAGLAADPYFDGDGIAILNYALTLEHLEAVFYRDALDTFATDDFDEGVFDLLGQIRDHEAAHVEALTSTINDLGGEPVTEGSYAFDYDDAASFLVLAATIENVGVAAYAGAAPSVAVLAPALVETALGIHSVEARHAGFLGALVDDGDISPFPDAVDAPLTPDEVIGIVAPFIVEADAAPADEATPGTEATTGGEVVVEMFDFGYEPAELTVAAGTTVTWTNTGQAPHNASADDGSFETEFLSNGQSASLVLDTPGTYPYVCTLHASLMQGLITVE